MAADTAPGRTAAAPRPTLATAFDPRHNSLNALRLVFALAVIVSHAWPLGGFGLDPFVGDLTIGDWAVAGFFAISGFLITGSRMRSSFLPYLQRRFLRIFPGLWACLIVIALVFVPIAALKQREVPSLAGLATFLGATAALSPRHLGWDGALPTLPEPDVWDGSLWTLFHEFACYLLVGFALTLAVVRRHRELLVLAFLAFVVVHAVDVELRPGDFSMPAQFVWLAMYFLAGAVLYAYREEIPVSWWAAGVCAGVVVVAGVLDRATEVAALPFAYLTLWLGIVLPLQRVGRRNDLSYGVYIYAFPVQQSLVLFGAAGLGVWAYTGLAVLLTLPLAAASWLVVEHPAMQLRKRRVALPAREPETDPVVSGPVA
jgi:peptidoglycan/LPS O-acetylase OafA/YrhL